MEEKLNENEKTSEVKNDIKEENKNEEQVLEITPEDVQNNETTADIETNNSTEINNKEAKVESENDSTKPVESDSNAENNSNIENTEANVLVKEEVPVVEISQEEIDATNKHIEEQRSKEYDLTTVSNQELLSLYNLLLEHKDYLELEKKKVEEEEK